MYTIISYENGQTADGIMLSASENTIRVALRHEADTTEFQRVYGVWTAEDGSPVEFECMVASPATDVSRYQLTEAKALTLTAN